MVNGRHLVQSEADIAQDLAMVSGNFSSDFTIFTFLVFEIKHNSFYSRNLQKWLAAEDFQNLRIQLIVDISQGQIWILCL